jgi:hypothetical protein
MTQCQEQENPGITYCITIWIVRGGWSTTDAVQWGASYTYWNFNRNQTWNLNMNQTEFIGQKQSIYFLQNV